MLDWNANMAGRSDARFAPGSYGSPGFVPMRWTEQDTPADLTLQRLSAANPDGAPVVGCRS